MVELVLRERTAGNKQAGDCDWLHAVHGASLRRTTSAGNT
jgi:hypothetical protein